MQDKPHVSEKTVWTPENIENVRVALQRSPCLSVWKHSRVLNLPELRLCNWNMVTLWFQQDCATAHTVNVSMNTLHAFSMTTSLQVH